MDVVEQIIEEIIRSAENILFVNEKPSKETEKLENKTKETTEDKTPGKSNKSLARTQTASVDKSVTFDNVCVVFDETMNKQIMHEEEKCIKVEDAFISDEEFLDKWSEKAFDPIRTVADITLVKFWFKLSEGRTHMRVLVPFARSAADISWLYNQGSHVTVVTGLRSVASTLLSKLSQFHSVRRMSSGTTRGWKYLTEDRRLEIIVMSYWEAAPHVLGSFDAVFDLEALATLHKKHQMNYVNIIKSLMVDNGFGIINGLETFGLRTYEAGGAHCLSLRRVKELFENGSGTKIECLEKKKIGSKLFQNTFYVKFSNV